MWYILCLYMGYPLEYPLKIITTWQSEGTNSAAANELAEPLSWFATAAWEVTHWKGSEPGSNSYRININIQ